MLTLLATVNGALTDPTNAHDLTEPAESAIKDPAVLLGLADGSNPYTNLPSASGAWPTGSGSGASTWPLPSGSTLWPSGTETATATATYSWPTGSGSSDWEGGDSSDWGGGSGNYDGGWANIRPWPASWGTRPKNYRTFRIVHATLAAGAFLIFFPVGGIVMRISRHPNAVRVHAAVQTTGYITFMTAGGFGIWMAKKVHGLDGYHPVIGLLLVCFINLQLLSGLVNRFFRGGRQGFPPSLAVLRQAHVWLGRSFILLGMINGGLGLRFASTLPVFQWPKGPKAAYGVVATIVFIIYLAVTIVWWELERPRRPDPGPLHQPSGRDPLTTPTTATNSNSNSNNNKSNVDANNDDGGGGGGGGGGDGTTRDSRIITEKPSSAVTTTVGSKRSRSKQ
ncbi:hypothetical protein PV08_09876 [Exophiala spinifera]|uniref:Cytochrome b561 domain-containing protein n=1 Tax=Exophiala spinifera TaxID=91928 RepID=A0A0D2B122_9EURO|nr:uncharacterized protein PV08_09876 [Exophiala spinifera]KIW12598.1 hypothetical protein PV08_09876 [Exophiala spinifera]